jgi:GTP-binding protein LepA
LSATEGDVVNELIRNFCIIAHIDHGKSTLADRFIQLADMVSARDFHDRLLDTMAIEKERGITIKSQAVSIPFESKGRHLTLNLVDTPGHVDFSYEVSRSISACEGALLLIDALQGVEAQTLANFYLAMEQDLEVIPVINKIDLPGVDFDWLNKQIEDDLGLDPAGAIHVSAKLGTGIDELLTAVVDRIPPPAGDRLEPLRGLVFDSVYDTYRGVIVHARLFDGELSAGDEIRFWTNSSRFTVEEVGTFGVSTLVPRDRIAAGDVGYFVASIRNVADAKVGDTVTSLSRPCAEPVPGFREVKPVVFASIYPIDSNDYDEFATALERLALNDAAITYEKDSSAALGFGFRCGFLGLLHMEIVQERLEREFDLSVILTVPTVRYRITTGAAGVRYIDNPLEYPDPADIQRTEEPYIRATIITPSDYVGPIINLCLRRRGEQIGLNYLDERRVELVYELPLAEVLYEFYDTLKSISRGYASFDYELRDYRDSVLARLDILLNGRPVDALSQLVFRESAAQRARLICLKLKEEIPRHQFRVPIQGAIGGTVVARETVSALRKDVTAKCYGGDITRKRKLLERQKKGKKRMKQIGDVQLPKSAFLAVLKPASD